MKCSTGVIEDFNFQFKPTLGDKLPSDQSVFHETHSSAVRCIGRCVAVQNCVSVFLGADLECQGFSDIYGMTSPSWTVKAGTRYYTLRVEGLHFVSSTL